MDCGAASVVSQWTEELCARLGAEVRPTGAPDLGAWLALGATHVCLPLPLAEALADVLPAADPLPPAARELQLFGPAVGAEEVRRACAVARRGCACLMVPPRHLAAALAELRATPVRVGTAVGGAWGQDLATVTRFAVGEALRIGAEEIDLFPAALEPTSPGPGEQSHAARLTAELRSLHELCHEAGATLRLALALDYAQPERLRLAALGRAAGLQWLKLIAAGTDSALAPAQWARLAAAFGAAPLAVAAGALPRPLAAGLCLRAAGSPLA